MARIKNWMKRHRMATTILLDLTFIVATGVFTLIALGPDSLLDEDCLGKRSGSCFESHTAAAVWAVLSGALTVFFLGFTIWAARTGFFKKVKEAEEPKRASGESAGCD
jgi:preprotein translocase subunit SecG